MTEFRCPVCDYKYGYVPLTSDNCHTCGVGFAFIERVKNDWLELQTLKISIARVVRAGELQVAKISEQRKEIERLKEELVKSCIELDVKCDHIGFLKERDAKLADELEKIMKLKKIPEHLHTLTARKALKTVGLLRRGNAAEFPRAVARKQLKGELK